MKSLYSTVDHQVRSLEWFAVLNCLLKRHYDVILFFFQGGPGLPGEFGEKGDEGPQVIFFFFKYVTVSNKTRDLKCICFNLLEKPSSSILQRIF